MTVDLVLMAARQYFNAFNSHSVEELSKLLSDEVVLTDWEIEKHGRKDVLSANAVIFSRVPEIHVKCIDIICKMNPTIRAACELEIELGEETIRVVDILSFNKELEIVGIRAYKG